MQLQQSAPASTQGQLHRTTQGYRMMTGRHSSLGTTEQSLH